MLTSLLVLSLPLLFAAPSQAQVENGSDSEGSRKVIISDSTAIRALEEAKGCIEIYRNALKMQSKSRIVDATRRAARSELLFEIYLQSNSFSGEKKKLVAGMKDAMSKMSIDFPQKVVVSDLSDQKRVVMPSQTVLQMLEANIKKFEIK